MSVDPYQNCPCGSGKKFKWCCQKLLKYAEKAQQLLEKGQAAAAVAALDEGLAAEPTSLWLRTMKAQILLEAHDHEPAHEVIADVLATNPGYLPVLTIRLQDELVHGDSPASVATLGEVLASASGDERNAALEWACIVARALEELGSPFAALQHLRFVAGQDGWTEAAARDLARIERQGELACWLRDSWDLRPDLIGDGTTGPRWQQALALAAAGRWAKAAELFGDIAAEQPGRPTAWLNLGLCRASSAQEEPAAEALDRYATIEPDEEQAIHAAALAQCLDARESEQAVDLVRIRYTIRDRTRLIQNLKEHPRLQVHFLDAADNQLAPEVKDEFFLLDKPALENLDSATLENLPAIVGVVRTRGPKLELEFADPAADDARPGLTTEAAGDTIDSSGDRSVAGTIPLSNHRMRRMWGMPAATRPEVAYRIRRMVHQQLYAEVWPDTPMGWLANKSPREAAGVPELKRSLHAAVLLVEFANESNHFDIDAGALRASLGLGPEPVLEGPDLDVDRLPLGRLRQVRAETLPAPRLRTLFDRATRCMLSLASRNAAVAIVARPAEREHFNPTAAFKVLIELAGARFDRAAATEWVERARRFDAETGVSPQRPTWEFSEWLISFRFDPPQSWAPRLAVLLTNFGKDQQSGSELMSILLTVGLVRVVPHPTDRTRAVLDTRMLDEILARYGTRQPGALDLTSVGAGPGSGIWTPDSARPGGSSIVLPGQEPPAPRGKIVLPGS